MSEAGDRRPFFRADHVGSLLRPENLLAARVRVANGEMDRDELRPIEDDAIREVVKLQEDVGLQSITDGEFRRENWWIDFISRIQGIEISEPDAQAEFMKDDDHGSGYLPKNVLTVGKLSRPGDIIAGEFRFLAACTERTPKVTLPSPSRIHFHGGRAAVDRTAYPDMDGFWADVAKLYQDEIAALEAAGCTYIQIDDPILSYFLDDRMRANLRDLGEDPDTLIHTYARVMNACIEKRRPGTHIALHICRGNAQSAWVVSGGYAGLAEAIFPVLDVDTYFLEYDDARSGDFEPLRLIPEGKNVVLGLITSKHGELESADEVKRRIDEASRFVPKENLALSPQCGFASIDLGNLVTVDSQIAKLRLAVEIADEVWGDD